MKIVVLLAMTLIISCASKVSDKKPDILSAMWMKTLDKEEVILLYGKNYESQNAGVIYKRAESSWPRFAFFFDHDGKVNNQFALLNAIEIDQLKKGLKCSWVDSENKISTGHSVKFSKSGKCDQYNVHYQFINDWGLYEVKWNK